MSNVKATYRNGTFVLEEPLEITDGATVELLVVQNGKKKKRKVADILAEIAALPLEGKTDQFSGRDHDDVLYGKRRNR
ncbi:MAG: hypothetical protein KF855_12465 [Acidobacteria bacterium]|nr:hypothetical protein [Acidobacteriota bacterium]